MGSNNHSYRIEINAQQSTTAYMKHYKFHPTVIDKKTKKRKAQSWTIDFWIKKNKVYIQTNHEPSEHTVEKILEGRAKYLGATLKKAKIIHLILYKEPLKIKHIHITGKEFTAKGSFKKMMFDTTLSDADKGYFDPLFSMVEESLLQNFSEKWKNKETILKLLECPFIENEACWTALNAFLCARSKCFEAERLLYNWMAFNAMYGYLDRVMLNQEKTLGYNVKQSPNENRAISRIITLEDNEKTIIGTRDDYAKICNQIRSNILRPYDIVDIENIIEDIKETSELSKKIEGTYSHLDTNYSAYDFMLTRFPYWLRCNLFHGGKPMPIISFRNSSLLNCLKLSNRLLDQYIETHLLDYFEEDYLQEKTLVIVQKNVAKEKFLQEEKEKKRHQEEAKQKERKEKARIHKEQKELKRKLKQEAKKKFTL